LLSWVERLGEISDEALKFHIPSFQSLGELRQVMTNGDALPGSSVQLAQRATQFQWDGNALEVGIGIAASGGGFRAMRERSCA